MTERYNKVMENFQKGYNCAQSVACAYADLYGADEKETFRATECFGRGMGMMGPCGVISAMAYLVGLKVSDGNLDAPNSKLACYDTLAPMTEEFLARNKSINCRELKGLDTGVMLRSCPGCMQDAAEIIEKRLL